MIEPFSVPKWASCAAQYAVTLSPCPELEWNNRFLECTGELICEKVNVIGHNDILDDVPQPPALAVRDSVCDNKGGTRNREMPNPSGPMQGRFEFLEDMSLEVYSLCFGGGGKGPRNLMDFRGNFSWDSSGQADSDEVASPTDLPVWEAAVVERCRCWVRCSHFSRSSVRRGVPPRLWPRSENAAYFGISTPGRPASSLPTNMEGARGRRVFALMG